MKAVEKKVQFDYQIEDKPVISNNGAAAQERIDFKGSRGELCEYLNLTNPELYNKAFVYTVNGKTRDWFDSLSSDFIYSTLKNYGFFWVNERITMVLKDEKKSEKLDEKN